jgi:putative transposase
MPIPDNLIDQLLAGCSSPDDILCKSGLLTQLTKRLAKHDAQGKNTGSSCNGKSLKTAHSVHGDIELAELRDRNGSFEPQFVKKGERQRHGFDDRIVSLYARGMSTRDIRPISPGLWRGVYESPRVFKIL